ncbi:MAG: type II toxin-antitoxin system HicB family antitoxin [Dehalococcoidales bacterium]|nr:type II toxin-antitoxin system HicB family antitoxin [Dehalococcoidales bacterium]
MVEKINVSIPSDLLEKLDQIAREEGTSRSALLARAVRHYLEEKEEEKKRQYMLQAAKEIDRIRESVEPWDATAEVLKWRDLH